MMAIIAQTQLRKKFNKLNMKSVISTPPKNGYLLFIMSFLILNVKFKVKALQGLMAKVVVQKQ
ncbi:hypothetical protein [Moraxella marmotae]|uniref:hypothetical protein n=1 Tax=Moraxella marmotae TaxID=3344520 RepID=UPI0035F3C1D8